MVHSESNSQTDEQAAANIDDQCCHRPLRIRQVFDDSRRTVTRCRAAGAAQRDQQKIENLPHHQNDDSPVTPVVLVGQKWMRVSGRRHEVSVASPGDRDVKPVDLEFEAEPHKDVVRFVPETISNVQYVTVVEIIGAKVPVLKEQA